MKLVKNETSKAVEQKVTQIKKVEQAFMSKSLSWLGEDPGLERD